MRREVEWNLLGTIVWEKLGKAPIRIEGDWESDWKRYYEYLNENSRKEKITVRDIVQDVQYVVNFAELMSSGDYEKQRTDERGIDVVQDERMERLNEVSFLSRMLMESFTLHYYQVEKELQNIERMQDSLEDRAKIKTYLDILEQIIDGNVDPERVLGQLREFHFSDEAMQDLAETLNEIVRQWNEHNNRWDLRYELSRGLRRWFRIPSNQGNSKTGRKKRLLRRVWEYYIDLPDPEYDRGVLDDVFFFSEYGLLVFLNSFFDTLGFATIVERSLKNINRDVMYINGIIGRASFAKNLNQRKRTFLDQLKRSLEKKGMSTDVDKALGAKCFSLMKKKEEGTTYFSFSGVNIEGDIKKVFNDVAKSLEGMGFVRVELDENVVQEKDLYVLEDESILTYKEYKKFVEIPGNKGDVDNRLFSCCERKLFTKLDNSDAFMVYVSRVSCYMCKRMAAYIRKNEGYVFCIRAGKDEADMEQYKKEKHERNARKIVLAMSLIP